MKARDGEREERGVVGQGGVEAGHEDELRLEENQS
jgi:hypothetical protein